MMPRRRRFAFGIAGLMAGALMAGILAAGAQNTPDFRGTRFVMEGGEAVYRGVCQGCHMADAKGAAGAGIYPALANNPRLASTGYVLSMIVRGRKGMPPFGAQFTDQQIADVVNYVRTHFGNHYKGDMTAADVQSSRTPK
jgi:mono/diheme cytochrome c family protein